MKETSPIIHESFMSKHRKVKRSDYDMPLSVTES